MTNNQPEESETSNETENTECETLNTPQNEDDPAKFYEDAKKYWSQIPATVDGMLGGFGFISDTDIKGSRQFLSFLFRLSDSPGKNLALDCGAGIGRITKHLLTPIFKQVDMVEQNPQFVNDSLKYIGKLSSKVRKQYPIGLQDFQPEKEEYDLIWCQWVLGHLKPDDLLKFLNDCKMGIKKNGVIVVKENVTSSNIVELDAEDSSVTRPHHVLRQIFERAGLDCIKDTRQNNFPKGLYGVHMFALRPKKGNSKPQKIVSELLTDAIGNISVGEESQEDA